jgi:hypothetical protein
MLLINNHLMSLSVNTSGPRHYLGYMSEQFALPSIFRKGRTALLRTIEVAGSRPQVANE